MVTVAAISLAPGIVRDLHAAVAVVRDADRACDDVIRDHRAADLLAQLDLRLGFAELAAAHQQRAACRLDRVPAFAVPVPLDEGAVAEPDRAGPGDARDL